MVLPKRMRANNEQINRPFCGLRDLSLGLEQKDGIRFINGKTFVNRKQDGSK